MPTIAEQLGQEAEPVEKPDYSDYQPRRRNGRSKKDEQEPRYGGVDVEGNLVFGFTIPRDSELIHPNFSDHEENDDDRELDFRRPAEHIPNVTLAPAWKALVEEQDRSFHVSVKCTPEHRNAKVYVIFPPVSEYEDEQTGNGHLARGVYGAVRKLFHIPWVAGRLDVASYDGKQEFVMVNLVGGGRPNHTRSTFEMVNGTIMASRA